jgi:hypothetical protein
MRRGLRGSVLIGGLGLRMWLSVVRMLLLLLLLQFLLLLLLLLLLLRTIQGRSEAPGLRPKRDRPSAAKHSLCFHCACSLCREWRPKPPLSHPLARPVPGSPHRGAALPAPARPQGTSPLHPALSQFTEGKCFL